MKADDTPIPEDAMRFRYLLPVALLLVAACGDSPLDRPGDMPVGERCYPENEIVCLESCSRPDDGWRDCVVVCGGVEAEERRLDL